MTPQPAPRRLTALKYTHTLARTHVHPPTTPQIDDVLCIPPICHSVSTLSQGGTEGEGGGRRRDEEEEGGVYSEKGGGDHSWKLTAGELFLPLPPSVYLSGSWNVGKLTCV